MRYLLNGDKSRKLFNGLEIVDDILSSVRGKCHIRLLVCLRHLQAPRDEIFHALSAALESCGQLGGTNAADAEEIEKLASMYRGNDSRGRRRRNRKYVLDQSADPDRTPPKRYVPPLAHQIRWFRGRLIRGTRQRPVTSAGDNQPFKRRKRLIYERVDSQESGIINVRRDLTSHLDDISANATRVAYFNNRDCG
eukprot:CAMPEP_0185041492 /NCGR_PEP_ID=MMETSP1103-20130426/40860_1 /TAXON_ID=36769 /ORGANISM="Paraphysomonas bandaiensis, Strain Caron Lab Isolate" /LENGTH=193 /DNA_ID=CAMNT_0027581239 /DNA_START=63 /DNA_END=640 /DNA_ORIENTATION=-